MPETTPAQLDTAIHTHHGSLQTCRSQRCHWDRSVADDHACTPGQSSELASAYFSPVSISVFSCAFASSRRLVSYSLSSPRGSTFTMPPSPNTTFCVKYGKSVMSDLQYAHSVRFLPLSPARTALPNLAPAYAIERVALPLPPFASTTSVPAFWTCLSKSGIFSASIVFAALSWENTGMMVAPAWPPMTGTLMKFGFLPVISPTNLFARTTSSVVMPTIFMGSRPFFLYNSAIAGTPC